MKNTGKPSEEAFERLFQSLGKKAFLHRFTDASDIKGLTGQVANASAQPSDYIVVWHGKSTFFAEVKSTVNRTAFPFNLLRPAQSAAGLQIEYAGGEYMIFAHALSLPNQPWFCFPYHLVRAEKARGKGSIKWDDLPELEF
jgi:penicillin-binding protein-related factor A (putative recombinase)